jgi:hypothetical protein
MTDQQMIILLGGVVSFLISIIGYFLHRLISGIDDSVKDLKEEICKDYNILTNHVDKLKYEISALEKTVSNSGVTINYIQKKMDELQKTSDLVASISNRLVATETKLDNLGKIIFVGQKKQ